MTHEEISALLFANLMPAVARLKDGGRLVHYTSAGSAFLIIKGKEVWLRNALLMNDFSEIEHGLACLHNAWSSEAGERFKSWLDRVYPGFREQLESTFDGHAAGLRNATFMMSLSEHDSTEDEFGRLSMWRAYGGACGVALVLRPEIFNSSTDEMKVYSAPVRYLTVNEFVSWFENWVQSIIDQEKRISDFEVDGLLAQFFFAFRVFALCTKHPGFREEREWRIFHSPLLDGTSAWLKKENEIVGGLPQEVVKLRLMDDESAGVKGAAIPSLVDRLIIGPTAHPVPVFHALYHALQDAGIEQPVVGISHIPLRT